MYKALCYLCKQEVKIKSSENPFQNNSEKQVAAH